MDSFRAGPATIIEQNFNVLTHLDEAIGLSRIVTAINRNGWALQEKERQPAYLHSNPARLNRWMGRETKKYIRKYADENTRLVGTFASALALENRGEKVKRINRVISPVLAKHVLLFFHAAQSLQQQNLGDYQVFIDTDEVPKDPRRLALLAVGKGEEGSAGPWQSFYELSRLGIQTFEEQRSEGVSIGPAWRTAEAAIAQTAIQMASHQPASQ